MLTVSLHDSRGYQISFYISKDNHYSRELTSVWFRAGHIIEPWVPRKRSVQLSLSWSKRVSLQMSKQLEEGKGISHGDILEKSTWQSENQKASKEHFWCVPGTVRRPVWLQLREQEKRIEDMVKNTKRGDSNQTVEGHGRSLEGF